MRRTSTLLLNLLLILGLMLSAGLAASFGTTGQRAASAAASGPPAGTMPALAGPRAKKHKHERKHNDRKKDRKHDRKHGHKHRGKRVPTGILPGGETDNPFGPNGKLSAKDHYIVRLKPATDNAARSSKAVARDIAGITPTFVYSHVFDGFAAVIPPDKLDAVRHDPRVAAVMPDFVVYADAQSIPTGIRRIDDDENPTAHIDGNDERVDVDVAVIDTAGKGTHEDLNQYAWANCTPSHDNSDDQGHGTHVSGIIGALDNGVGVVGVAPGARIWNLRSLVAVNGGGGSGLGSWIICGLDLVTQYATDQGDGLGDIEVANLSLGGTGTDSTCQGDLYHLAFCQAVDAGVTVVVAAGNSHANASGFVPAAYDEVITVSALADSDGQPGGVGGPTPEGSPDDTLADFSNFGADVDIAAPGVDILSTVPTGSCQFCDPSGYGVLSGTSMASPHVAGAAALYLATHAGATPAQVKAALLAARENVALPNDPDGINEGVLNVGAAFSGLSASKDHARSPAAEAKQAKGGKHAESKHGKSQHGKQKSKNRKKKH
jgi:subtilisin